MTPDESYKNTVRNAKVTTRGRVTVPPDIRQIIGLKPGGIVRFKIEKDGTVYLTAPEFLDGPTQDV